MNNAEVYNELMQNDSKENKYINIGSLLRNRRLDMNISLDDLAKTLKLSIPYIALVEEGDYENVSKKIYYYGYVRSIARYLKLDEEVVLRYLVDEVKTVYIPESKKSKLDDNILSLSIVSGSQGNKKNNRSSFIKYFLICFCVAVIVTIGLAIKYQYEIKQTPFDISEKQNVKL